MFQCLSENHLYILEGEILYMFSKDTKASIGIALAYLSFIVGAGFTTGQEFIAIFR